MGSSGSGWEPVADPFEHGNEPSDCIKFWEYLERLSKKDLEALWNLLA
jgi:hypothetical protein